jgi:hypothetical protein
MADKITVACYYFPNYHVDKRNEACHGPGWTEWELVKRAEPRFPGHRQPRVPLWGALDESDPQVMETKIAAAAGHGIDAFLFDWYWYNDGPFLQNGLECGFLLAPNHPQLKFALMWANHDWTDIHPAKVSGVGEYARVLYPGAVTTETFDLLIDTAINRYFPHPSYWMIDNCPYFSIYDLSQFISGIGGPLAAREALSRFRQATQKAGFHDLHLNAVVWNRTILPGETVPVEPVELLHLLGFNSFSSYVWVHHTALNAFPETPYEQARKAYFDYWDRIEHEIPLPYIPNVTMGWDPSPRTVQSDRYLNAGYPFTPVLSNNTPQAFEAALRQAKGRLEARQSGVKVLTINAWNEWTEGSYLEPDTEHGLAYLHAVKQVFG